MRSCYCTNQCPECGTCCRIDCGCRRTARGWRVAPAPNTVPFPSVPVQPVPTMPPIEVGKTHREPLTEEEIRRIIREELDRDRDDEKGQG